VNESAGEGLGWYPGSRFIIVCSACPQTVFIVPFLNFVDTARNLLVFLRCFGEACSYCDFL